MHALFMLDQRLGKLKRKSTRRKGAIAVLAAILMVVMLGMMAFAIDLGYMYSLQTELQRACDAAALAGVKDLPTSEADAQSKAVEYLVRNPVGNAFAFNAQTDNINAKVELFLQTYGQELNFKAGSWNSAERRVDCNSNANPSSLSVSRTYANLPLFFAPVLGVDTFSITAESVATFQPRDIVLVLDYSASMNDDSTFNGYSKLGQSTVDANLLQCYQELNSPSYGSLAFEPNYASAKGVAPTNSTKPQIYVEYRNTTVVVSSSLNLENVVLKFSNNATNMTSGLTGTTGTFTGTGANAGKTITNVWVKSGNNLSGQGTNYGEPFDFSSSGINATIKNAWGLNSVAYPYPSGSWDDYINFCKNTGNSNNTGGYRYKFGYKSLINYWLDQKPAYSQTPDLWKISAQPVTSLKDSVDLFVNFLKEIPTDDNLGLSIYDATNGNAILESALTTNFNLISNIVRQRQAGHYHSYTNIGAGMQTAREHLDAYGRTNAKKMIILMTDGNANWHNGQYDISGANQHVIDEANLCAAASRKYPIITISLGVDADTSIMQQVADISNGTHFIVPGGATIQAMQVQLEAAFRKIANARPIKLVK